MNDTNIFIPFEKRNDEERMVYGYASTESVDSQGEIVEKEAILRALPDYMKFANIREMHQPSAVGKTQTADMDDNGLFISVKVVDDNAWAKVKEGVYNGFSIGGRANTRVGNRIKDLTLSEISLVDRPANQQSVFTMVKFDGLSKSDSQEPTDGRIMISEISDEEMMEMETRHGKVADFLENQVSIAEVSQVIEMVHYLIYMIVDRIYAGKDTSDLEAATEKLKSAASKILGDTGVDKIDGLISLAKQMNTLDVNKFAYVSPEGVKSLPIADKEMVEKSVTNFMKTSFAHNDFRVLAARVIKANAEKYGVRSSQFINNASTEPLTGEVMKSYYSYDVDVKNMANPKE